MRRQARGGEPDEQRRPWVRKLVLIGAGLSFVLILTLLLIFLWSWSHVRTTYAGVHATVVEMAFHMDARLLELQVRPGQAVVKGEELARLDDSELLALLEAAEAGRDIRKSLHNQAELNSRFTKERVEADIKLAEALYEQERARLERIKKGPQWEEIEIAKARTAAAEAMADLYALEVKQSEQLVGEGVDSEHLLAVKKAQLTTQQNKVRETRLQLARLEKGATAEELEAARQAVAAREAQLARAKTMSAEAAIASEQLKASEAELKKAEADVAARRATLKGMSIVSPITGTVIQTFKRVGEICSKGRPIILVADDSAGRWVEGYIHEKDASRVRKGQRAKVEIIVGSGDYVEGEVEAVALATSRVSSGGPGPAGQTGPNRASRFVWVKLRLLDQHPDWRPGMSARAVIRVR